MGQYIFVFILVVVFLLLMSGNYLFDQYQRKMARLNYQRSAGTYDRPARAALEQIETIRRPTAGDRFRAGHILENNVLGGRDGVIDAMRDGNAMIGRIVVNFQGALPQIARAEDDDLDVLYMIAHIENFAANINRTDLAEAATRTRREAVARRKDEALASANNRAAAADHFLKSSVKYTNDPQNVHDTAVNMELRGIYERVKQENRGLIVDPRVCAQEAAHATAGLSVEKKASVNAALAAIMRGGALLTFNDTEDQVFAHMWRRADHPKNAGRKSNMRQAMISALVDCVERETVVCANGRTARLVNAYAAIDDDETIGGGVATSEAYKNQIYEECKQVLDASLVAAAATNDEDLQSVARSYRDGSTVSEEAEKKFSSMVRARIDNLLSRYSDKLPPAEIERARETCYVFANI